MGFALLNPSYLHIVAPSSASPPAAPVARMSEAKSGVNRSACAGPSRITLTLHPGYGMRPLGALQDEGGWRMTTRLA
jgi:hypothetical protein